MRFRLATTIDVFPIINLYQKSITGKKNYDPLYLDYRKLEEAIASINSLWILAEVDGTVKGSIAMLIDRDQKICKITRMMVDPSEKESQVILKESLKYTLHYLGNIYKDIEIVYTTTLTMTLEQQAITLQEGFRILGVFPNVLAEDSSGLNGLSAYFYPGILEEKRISNFSLHPVIAPFYEITRRETKLLPLNEIGPIDYRHSYYQNEAIFFEELPSLELITAPNFVLHRFYKLKQGQTQQVSFYPFYAPNHLITDPKQEIEIFCKVTREMNFAAIIGEHLSLNVDPITLYSKVQTILRNEGISYIEIINDASDSFGIECILKSGFTPCAYFPAFKRQGTTRRDYVIFGKSFEYLCRPQLKANPSYIDFYREYFKIEGKNYFPDF